MSLTSVWVQTMSDGLVRADQIVGVVAHRTPQLAGKPARWLLDVVLGTPIGSGGAEHWSISALHRTLSQTDAEPVDAPATLAKLLAQLDVASAAGVIHAAPAQAGTASAAVRFTFSHFSGERSDESGDLPYL